MTESERAETGPADAGRVVGPPPHRTSRARGILATLITLVVLAVVFVGILPKLGNYSDAWDAIKDMSVGQLVVLGSTVIVSILVYVTPFQAALPGLGYWPAFMVRQTSFTISNAIPAGGAVGLGVQYGMLASAGFSGAAATSAIGITSVFNLLVTLALPVFGLLALLVVEPPSTAMVLGAIGGLVAVAALVGVLAVVFGSEGAARRVGATADRVAGWLFARLRREPPGSAVNQVLAFRTSTVGVVSDRWPAITFTNVAQQLTQFAVLAAAMRITQVDEHAPLPLAAVFAAFALARLAGFIPITPGGLGTVDAGLTGLLITFGADRTDALAATLLWRAASWVPQVALGFITLAIWRIRSGHLPRPAPVTPEGGS